MKITALDSCSSVRITDGAGRTGIGFGYTIGDRRPCRPQLLETVPEGVRRIAWSRIKPGGRHRPTRV